MCGFIKKMMYEKHLKNISRMFEVLFAFVFYLSSGVFQIKLPDSKKSDDFDQNQTTVTLEFVVEENEEEDLYTIEHLSEEGNFTIEMDENHPEFLPSIYKDILRIFNIFNETLDNPCSDTDSDKFCEILKVQRFPVEKIREFYPNSSILRTIVRESKKWNKYVEEYISDDEDFSSEEDRQYNVDIHGTVFIQVHSNLLRIIRRMRRQIKKIGWDDHLKFIEI